jgi:hypothetical protein
MTDKNLQNVQIPTYISAVAGSFGSAIAASVTNPLDVSTFFFKVCKISEFSHHCQFCQNSRNLSKTFVKMMRTTDFFIKNFR